MERPRSVPDAGLSAQYLTQATCNLYSTAAVGPGPLISFS